ncbi:6290_t:CDS:1 [Dentiscutata heterogama]|uniref:6290_t:CDS:1 n=1 Tax=Dentiscutata heterogama TaxID=1316150 RepID=A0ACA9N4G0_9GLOM|nr:6290_t:CDS:1 [Dentiscutata heterogama]
MNIGTFLNETSAIEKNIETIHGNIKRIQSLQSNILVATSTNEVDAISNERNRLMNDTRQMLIENKDRIKQIEYENARLPRSDPNYDLRTQRHGFLREKLSNILNEYRGAEDEYIKQQTERTVRQYKIVNPSATQQEIDDYMSSPSGQPVFQQALLRSGEARAALDQVKRRHNDIKRVEETIAELADLFKELYLQVEAQDKTIVDIEDNATATATKLEKANEDLDRAHASAAAARKKKWICLAITLIILAIIAAVVVYEVLNLRNKN